MSKPNAKRCEPLVLITLQGFAEARFWLAAEDCRFKWGWNADLEGRYQLPRIDLKAPRRPGRTAKGVGLSDFAMSV
jgi:hypothetical protein